MYTDLVEFFSYRFAQNALFASVLVSIIAGFVGTYIVARRLVFLSGGITHASFGGIGIAYYFGLNPVLGAAVFAVLSAFGVDVLASRKTLREDSAIGILWSLGMALGVFFIFLTPGYAPNLMSYLFGSILTVSGGDLQLLVVLTLIIGLFFALFYRPILFTAFDPEFAQTQQTRVGILNHLLKVFIALAIVFSIRSVGIILIISLLTIPASTANIFTKRFGTIIYLSSLLSFVASVLGLVISYRLNVPSGATIIMVLVVMFALTKLAYYVRLKFLLFRADHSKNLTII